MHFATAVNNWTDALKLMPDGSFIKSISNPSLLREAKQVWAAAGRDPKKLFTDYRHYFSNQDFGADYPAAVAQWKRNFATFIDGTFLRDYSFYVDACEEYNEYYDEGMADNDPDVLAIRLINARAAADVWNDFYRGRVVHSADGGEGLIPASCRLIIGNSPVGNRIPKEIFQLAVATDNIIGTHPYQHVLINQWPPTGRDPQDFRFHSGRWNYDEQQYGIKPLWAFTETGPYAGADEGWRHPTVLGGDESKLVEIFRLWLKDLATTAAYREGRILGCGAWFTSTTSLDWAYYHLDTPQLVKLATAAADIWRPGQETPMPNPTPDNSAVIRSAIADLDSARAKLASIAPVPPVPPAPTVLFKVKVLVPVLNVRAGPAATFSDLDDVLKDQVLDVYAVAQPSGWYKVAANEERYISGSGAYTVKI